MLRRSAFLLCISWCLFHETRLDTDWESNYKDHKTGVWILDEIDKEDYGVKSKWNDYNNGYSLLRAVIITVPVVIVIFIVVFIIGVCYYRRIPVNESVVRDQSGNQPATTANQYHSYPPTNGLIHPLPNSSEPIQHAPPVISDGLHPIATSMISDGLLPSAPPLSELDQNDYSSSYPYQLDNMPLNYFAYATQSFPNYASESRI